MELTMMPHVETEPADLAGPIVVATDGLPQSRDALTMARVMAHALGRTIHAVAVHPSTALTAADGQILLDPDVVASMRADLTRRVKEQCRRDGSGESGADDFEILNGEPARVITDVGIAHRARLIVIGLGRHALVDRFFGDETALKVARTSRIPVLAVPEGARGIPTHAIVGIDFSEGSLRAAQAASGVLVEGGVLELVHVVPRERLMFDAWVSQEEYMHFVRHSLTRFRARLTVPANVRVEESVLSGDPAHELLSYANRIGAELVAAGSHGHGFLSRLILGSVTTTLLRAATCSVLVIPAATNHSDRDGASANATLTIDRGRWSEVLDDFTRRNIGRRTHLQVESAEIGSRAQEGDYPLLGVTFDPIDQRVEIMLGELGAGEPHLSRSVGGVEALDVLTNREDQDIALRLRHGTDQTILTLIRF